MGHHDYVRQNGQWFGVSVPTARDMREFDNRSSKGIDGYSGGAWNPLKPIVIGGQAGVGLSGTVSFEGGVTTSRGGRMQLGNNDYPTFTSARTRSVVFHLVDARLIAAQANYIEICPSPRGLRIPYLDATLADLIPFIPIPNRFIHSGATLASAVLKFRVGRTHAAVPAQLPQFDINSYGATRASLLGLLSTGFAVLPTPGSGAAYYAAGAVQSITMTCDQNNTALAPSTTSYGIRLKDEASTNSIRSFNVFHSLTLNFTAIADMRPE